MPFSRLCRSTPHHSAPRLPGVASAAAFVKQTLRAVKLAATDKRIPKPLRWLAALGLAPIPGPIDEIVLLVVAIPLALFYRRPLIDAWQQAANPQRVSPS